MSVEVNKEENNVDQKKKMTMKNKLRNTVEKTNNLNTIYENTFDLKKDYYEKRLEYMRRSTEAKERLANRLENCNMC